MKNVEQLIYSILDGNATRVTKREIINATEEFGKSIKGVVILPTGEGYLLDEEQIMETTRTGGEKNGN